MAARAASAINRNRTLSSASAGVMTVGREPKVAGAAPASDDGETAPGDAGVHAEDGALEHLFAAV
jgi:hypothetical protein